MGVPGLTTFIEAHPELLVPLKLQNRSVVINGNGLVHWLFFYHKQNFTFGVNYKDFEELCAKFLQTLQVCKIRAYILFDGALEDGKFQKFMKHNEKRIQAYSSVVRGSKCQLLSGFAYAVFTKVARKFRVPFCCCDFEADREVALLANALDCSVVGDDGDFFIFDIKAGYIPWNTFKWKHILKNVSTEVTAKQYIHVRCKVFYQQRFCEKFAIGKPLLPLMACLLGNDLISDQHTAHFYRHPTVMQSSQPRLRGRENAACRPKKANQKKLLDWLSSYQSSDAALRDVMKIFESGEENIGKKIEFAVQTYLLHDAESKFKNYLTDIEAFNKLPTLNILGSLPKWFVHLFRMGDLQPKFINVIFQRRYWTHLFVEDKRKPSCNRSSLHIRQAIFGILLKNREVGTETGDDANASKSENFGSGTDRQSNIDYVNAKKKFVTEYDRLDAGGKLTSTDIVPLEELESYGPLPHLWHIPELSCENRRALLIQVLGFNLSSIASIPSEYQLPVAVIVYWMQNADPKVSTHQLMAILLCIVRGHTCDNFQKDDDPKVLTRAKIFEVPSCASIDRSLQKGLTGGDEQNSESQTDFRNLNTSERHLSLVQACAQWQSCMQYATYLNTILQDPFQKPDITKLYHGTEISTTYYELIDFELPKQIDWICRYLKMIPKSKNAAEMFVQMYEVVKVYCKEVEPQLPDLGRFSKILQEGYVKSAANVFKRKGYSIPTYDHIDEKDERVICFNCGELDHKSPACSHPKNQCSLCEKWGHNSKFCSTIKTFNRHSDFNSTLLSQTQPTERIVPKAIGPDAPIKMVSSGCAGVGPMLVEGFSGLSLEKWLENDTNVSKQGSDNLRGKGYMTVKERRIRCFNCGDFDHKSPVCHRPKNKCSLCEKWGHDSKFCSTIKKFNRHSDFNSIPLSQTQPTERIVPKVVGPDAPIKMVSSGCAGVDPMLVEGFWGLSLEKWLENDTNVSIQGSDNLRGKGYMKVKERRIRCFNCGDFDHKSSVCHRPKNKCSLCEKWGHDSKFCYTKGKTLCI